MTTRNLSRTTAGFLLLAAGACSSSSTPYFDQIAELTHEAPPRDRLDWWREARFGMFIHWGLYAIPAGEWKDRTDHGEWIMTTAQIPVPEYERFREQFNPTGFDADEWVSIAKAAGMKYIVITSKHHDGFCLFDSKETDHDVISTPFRRDILRELAAACRRQGIRICWYYSIMDWHHPDYLPRRDWESRPAASANFDRYVKYLNAQVRELLSKYGSIGVMWFDGEWESTWNHARGQALYDLCRKLQPDIIVNNRVDVGRGGMAGMTASGNFAGDFGTPEQEIPEHGLPGVDWESCMTMNDHWGYNKNDKNFKSTATLVRMLSETASKGGNLLLNVGPTAEGKFPQESVDRLREIGKWMAVNGEAIYGTTANPFSGLVFGRCTVKRKGDRSTLYFHVYDWPKGGELRIPGIGNDPIGARLLATRAELPVERDGSDLRIRIPAEPPDPICSVVALEVVGAPIVYDPPVILTPSEIFVMPTTFSISAASKDLEIRYTIDGTEPTETSAIFTGGRIPVLETTTVKARTYHRGKPAGPVASQKIERVSPAPSIFIDLSTTKPGVASERFEGRFTSLPDFDSLTPVAFGISPRVQLEPGDGEHFARRISGFFSVPEDNVYEFVLESDDGSSLTIGGEKVIDNDGLHSATAKSAKRALARGLHRIRVEYFNATGGKLLSLRMGRAGTKPEPIAEEALRYLEAELPAIADKPKLNVPGLTCETYPGEFTALPKFGELQPASRRDVAGPSIGDPPVGNVAMRFGGFLAIPADGLYTLVLGSDDGSRLWIDNVLLLDNDGVHAYEEKSGSRPLAAGNHPVVIEYFNVGEGARLEVKIGRGADPPQPIPNSWWRR